MKASNFSKRTFPLFRRVQVQVQRRGMATRMETTMEARRRTPTQSEG